MPEPIDNESATPAGLNRRAFVAAAAAAAALPETAARAAAQTGAGRPHPPFVAENDPAIAVGTPQIHYGNRALDAYYASPRNAGPATPAIVVVQAVWGVDAQLRDTARRLAKAGYIAVAPDLYTGLGAPSGDNATDVAPFRSVAEKLSDEVVDADIAATVRFVREGGKPLKSGVVGFCMGGGIALRQTVDNADLFDAAVVFYGKVRYGTTGNGGAITPFALAYAGDIRVPLCGSWGATDTSIVPSDVGALASRLDQLKKPSDLRVYDGAGHAFFDDTRTTYAPSAAEDAWTRTLAWFKQYLT